jgi:hypothetical protein
VNRDRLLIAAAVVCVAAAVLLVLVARDVGRWQSAMRAGDVAASPANASRQVDETLPFSPGRSLLGLDDDVTYRRAAALFRRASLQDEEVRRTAEGGADRIRAEAALAEAIRTEGDSDRTRASAASNLLGVLAFFDAAAAQSGSTAVERAVLAFQDALRLDRSNADAKTNLELLYQEVASTSSVRGRERLQRSAHAGASASEVGHGY